MVAKVIQRDCRFCRKAPTRVLTARVRSDGSWQRDRLCVGCGVKYMTIEALGPVSQVVPLAQRLKEIEKLTTMVVRLAAEAEFYLQPEERDPSNG